MAYGISTAKLKEIGDRRMEALTQATQELLRRGVLSGNLQKDMPYQEELLEATRQGIQLDIFHEYLSEKYEGKDKLN